MHSSDSGKLRIHALLNPTTDGNHYDDAHSSHSPFGPATMRNGSPLPSSPTPQATPNPTTLKRQKLVKDGAVFERGPLKAPNNFPPYECGEPSAVLTSEQQLELAEKHKLFQIFPTGVRSADDGLISEFPRRIPYSSDKKDFLEKTGKDAVDVFQYTFKVPGKSGKEWVVMWDYNIGLVRVTPFFKACEYGKTIPAKSLNVNGNLKEITFSLTGGALAAQGYWIPFQCARAICQTFCYNIRWALTPVFGPSFIKDCIPPGHRDFARFKIDPELMRCAHLEAATWKTGGRHDTPMASYGYQGIPRSAPEDSTADKHFLSQASKPTFKAGSPFDERNYTHSPPTIESPALSPKSIRGVPQPSQWTSINSSPTASARLPAPMPPASLNRLLLDEPRYSPITTWRATDIAARNETSSPMPTWSPEGAHTRTRARKRRSTSVIPSYAEPASSPSSKDDNEDPNIGSAPLTSKKRKMSPRARDNAEGAKQWKGPTEFSAEDANAARLLLSLHTKDAELASTGPNVVRDEMRRRDKRSKQ
ncbi:APSES transcription factor Xbp1 like [Lecanosticta acicola]|uniref:APSES transcription factor Xbp1 like n=1 Tax=Lecanosticta acicola TaxID=111012 RepID=A0AAI8W1H4_9PEZI|nr:APSES transcription factor Xbp1 like [Lecanosticta acicola]